MELILSATCEDAQLREDGRIDLLGVFGQLQAPGFPAAQEHMTVVFVLEWEPEEEGRQPLLADLVDASGRKVLTIEGHTEVGRPAPGSGNAQTKLVMPIERVVFPAAGRYEFRLTAGGTTRRACSIHVRHSGAAEDADPAGRPRV